MEKGVSKYELPRVYIPEGANVTLDSRGDEFCMLTQPDVDYPVNVSNQQLSDLLLKTYVLPDGSKEIILPENFIALSELLDEAARGKMGDDMKGTTRSLLKIAAKDLGELAESTSLVPVNIGHQHIIFSGEGTTKLLPPMSFVKFGAGYSEQARKHIVQSFDESLAELSRGLAQKQQLYGLFGAFVAELDK
jgi:hypothetical protein